MKKHQCELAAIVVFLALVLVGVLSMWFSKLVATSEFYPTTAVVIEVDTENNVVTCRDFGGRVWQFRETDDWYKGDIVSMLMDDHGTQSVIDDTVIKVRYSGYFE